MAQQNCGPPSLPVGTEVSAKYRGAFCEATVKTVVRVVKCKVMMKDCQSSVFVTDDEIKGLIKLSAVVEVKHPDTGQPVQGIITKLVDQSTYTVVFDDGDERTLRRTQLCLKGDKHFIESETLDNLPLSHPEHFGTPVLQNKKARRRNGDESEEEEEAAEEDSEEESPRRATYRGRHQELVGKLMLVDVPNRKGSVMPALVVLPDANSLNEVKGRDHILLRSFKDSKFVICNRKELKEFIRSVAIKNEDKTMRIAYEKALLFYDTKELPVGWNKSDMLGSDVEDEEDDNEVDEYASEDEPFEEKDRFVAQLYKFMDDRGTPINKGPCIGNKDLNLYRLFKVVQSLGGYNKVTKEMKWPVVYSRMGLPSLHQNPSHQVKTAYKKYLDAYETFYRKLGSTMGTNSRPGRARQNTGRNILSFRAREKSPRSPKPSEKNKEEAAESPKSKTTPVIPSSDKNEDLTDSTSVTSAEENDMVTRRTPRRDARITSVKEGKEKKDDTVVKQKETTLTTKTKKEDVPGPSKQLKKDEQSPVPKGKKTDTVKKEEESVKKEERKSVRKIKLPEESKEPQDKDEKKVPLPVVKKEKVDEKIEVPSVDSTPTIPSSPKKRITRRKLLSGDPAKDSAVKDDVEETKDSEVPKKIIVKDSKQPAEKKDTPKTIVKDIKPAEKKDTPKTIVKDMKPAEKKDTPKTIVKEIKPVEKKDIPKTLERRDNRISEKSDSDKNEVPVKAAEKKETDIPDKKTKPTEKKKRKLNPEVTGVPHESVDQIEEYEKPDPKVHFAIGCKLRVKYGAGKNQKIYMAKVVDHGKDGNHKTYRVHYAGWNTRYDEWIRPDRVVSVVDKPDSTKSKPLTTTPKATTQPTVASPSPSPLVKKETTTPLKATGSQEATAVSLFRTPKVLISKSRATRSSSTENASSPSSKTTGSRKRMTRRGSSVTDSGGSQSPGSQHSSDLDDNDDSESTKDDKEENDDNESVDVEGDDKAEQEKSEEDESNIKDISVSEPGSVKTDEDYDTEEYDNKDCDIFTAEETTSLLTADEICNESDTKLENHATTSQDEVAVREGSTGRKAAKCSVSVTEVTSAVYEIVSSVSVEELSLDIEPDKESAETPSTVEASDTVSTEKSVSDNTSDALCSNKELPKEEVDVIEENIVDKDSMNKIVDVYKADVDDTLADTLSHASIPQLTKEVLEPAAVLNVEDRPLISKTSRGRKKEAVSSTQSPFVKEDHADKLETFDVVKDTVDVSNTEIPLLEPISVLAESTCPARLEKEPSPYDFDDAAESTWKPEITKKYEPLNVSVTSNLPTSIPDHKSPVVSEDDNEKKKVKKKVKKKPISPEFVADSKTESLSSADELKARPEEVISEIPNVESNTSGEKSGLRKKGRKKKDSVGDSQAKKDENQDIKPEVDVKSVRIEQDTAAAIPLDQEQSNYTTKRRRPKRVSESDVRDIYRPAKVMRKAGVRSTSKGPSTSADPVKPNEEVSSSLPDTCTTPADNTASTTPTDNTASTSPEQINNLPCRVREPSFCESQGFEPQDSHDGAVGTYDNTPPTTPEHEDNDNNSQQLAESEALPQPNKDNNYSSSAASESYHKDLLLKTACTSSSATSSLALSVSSTTQVLAVTKSSSESPSDNDVISTTSTDNLDSGQITNAGSDGSGTDQDVQDSQVMTSAGQGRKRRHPGDRLSPSLSILQSKKKKRVHGTRSRTAKKSPKYVPNSDSQGSASNTPNHFPPESPPTKFPDLTKSPRPSKFNFNADLGEYLEGEARCNFLIAKMKEIKSIYMGLKSEVATIDRRRKRAKRKEKEASASASCEKDSST